MKLPNKKLKELFENVIKITFKNSAPKSKLSSEKQDLYKFEDDLYFSNKNFSSGALLLKQYILDNIRKHKEEVNFFTSIELLEYICKSIYIKIKSRVETINDSLDIYLKSEDIDYGFTEISRKLENSFGEYTIYFISNLLSLQDIDLVNIGKVSIKRIDKKIIEELPPIIEKPFFSNVYSPLQLELIEGDYLDPNRFIQEFEGKALFEVVIKGYQVNNEKSDVFEGALREFKYILSYFSICKTFLKNVASDQYSIKTKEIKKDSKYGSKNNYQIYYLKDNKDPKILKELHILSNYITLPEFAFIIDKASLEKIEKRCCLNNFNMIIQNGEFGTIGNKIKRSLDWVYKEMLEKDETDKAIALFISLETLISYGHDPLIGLTDEYAENIAIMTHNNVEDRFNEKKYFKKKVYQLRNDIMHNGYEVLWDKDWDKIERLKIYVAWALRWFIKNIDTLMKIGNNTNAVKEYFEREKLK
ncbi:MAG: hypothetical protein WBF68_06565 [Atribacterota bacterium]|jgi:hypothetical protein